MASGTGLAGLAVTALVSALVAFGVASVLSSGPPAPPPPSGQGKDAAEDLRKEVARLRAEMETLRAARPAPAPLPGKEAAPRAPGEPGAAKAGGAGPDAPLPATRGELQALIDERILAQATGEIPAGAKLALRKRMTIEEAGAELGLSSVDIDSVKRVWQESETEMIACVMGTSDIEQIKEEVKAAREDPDKKAALVNKAVGNLFRNLGRVATVEDRRDRELRKFLPEEKVKALRSYNLRSSDEGMDDVFGGLFNK